MEDSITTELNALFAHPPTTELPSDVLGELRSILRLHSLSPQELFYKWESYSIKMGSEETKLDLDTTRAFKTDVQESLERESRGKVHTRNNGKRSGVPSTPRAAAGGADVYNLIDGLLPNTPHVSSASRLNSSAAKRKATFDSPSVSIVSHDASSTTTTESKARGNKEYTAPHVTQHARFADRSNAGQTIETLNDQLPLSEPMIAPFATSRIKLGTNTDLTKFSYRPMAMHLSEASEVLDDRIDEYMALFQSHHGLDESAFGNPSSQSINEIVAIGRIASDSPESKLNVASLVLETSRRMGAGLRVPLKLDDVSGFAFFPGQIVALRGINASGEHFTVKELLEVPLLPPAVSPLSALDSHIARMGGGPDSMELEEPQPLNVLLASGPYTADDNLDFEPLKALCEKASGAYADAIILTGPFLDLEHPLIASGDFDLPDELAEGDDASLITVFKSLISAPLQSLARAVPNITIIILPSVRDAVSRHVSWPQEPLPRKELGLPRRAVSVSNPVSITFNECLIGISAQDILYELRQEEAVSGTASQLNLLARLPRHLIEQRHFFPLFPPSSRANLPKSGANGLATGAMLDISYLKLGEWLNARPDILITPSALPYFVKVVENVLVINPGSLSKRKGPGTYAQLTMYPLKVTDEERAMGEMILHKVFERTRVDILRI